MDVEVHIVCICLARYNGEDGVDPAATMLVCSPELLPYVKPKKTGLLVSFDGGLDPVMVTRVLADGGRFVDLETEVGDDGSKEESVGDKEEAAGEEAAGCSSAKKPRKEKGCGEGDEAVEGKQYMMKVFLRFESATAEEHI